MLTQTLSFIEREDCDIPFFPLQDDSAYDGSLLIIDQPQQGKASAPAISGRAVLVELILCLLSSFR